MNILINICGGARTGSTMFDLILGNDPKAFSLGEVNAWFRPWRTHHFNINCSCGKSPCPKWELIKDLKENIFHQKAFQLLGVEFLIDSSKDLSWVIDNNLWTKFHGSYNVLNLLIYKQPVSFAFSYWKRNRKIKEALKSYNYYKRFLDSNLSFYSISYEEFVRSPEVILKNICRLTGMDYSAEKLNFWEKEHHHLFGSFGTRKQVVQKQSKIYKEKYPEEFEKLIPKINREAKNNQKINKIIENIEQRDIKTAENIPPIHKIKKGHYYYLKKLKSKLKRRYPERYADKESNLLNTDRILE